MIAVVFVFCGVFYLKLFGVRGEELVDASGVRVGGGAAGGGSGGGLEGEVNGGG